jgi:hypothetical protein
MAATCRRHWAFDTPSDADTGRGGGTAPAAPEARLAAMLEQLNSDKLWIAEYDDLVRQVSFARPNEQITFADALDAAGRLASVVYP